MRVIRKCVPNSVKFPTHKSSNSSSHPSCSYIDLFASCFCAIGLSSTISLGACFLAGVAKILSWLRGTSELFWFVLAVNAFCADVLLAVLNSGEGGTNGPSLLGRRKKEAAGLVGVLPTMSAAGDVLGTTFLKPGLDDVDGTQVPMLDGGMTSSLLGSGVSAPRSALILNTSLKRLFAGVALTWMEGMLLRYVFLTSVFLMSVFDDSFCYLRTYSSLCHLPSSALRLLPMHDRQLLG